jgi:ADP-ribosylation factor protein 1
VLVFANKQDMGVMGVPEITERLGLHQMRGKEWFIQGCCALTGDGLYDGLDWLTKVMQKKN